MYKLCGCRTGAFPRRAPKTSASNFSQFMETSCGRRRPIYGNELRAQERSGDWGGGTYLERDLLGLEYEAVVHALSKHEGRFVLRARRQFRISTFAGKSLIWAAGELPRTFILKAKFRIAPGPRKVDPRDITCPNRVIRWKDTKLPHTSRAPAMGRLNYPVQMGLNDGRTKPLITPGIRRTTDAIAKAVE